MTHALNPETLELLESTIRNDISAGDYDGARVIVARHGEVALDATIGWADRAAKREMQQDSIFRVLSLTKAFTNALVYQAIGEGKLALSTRVVDVIPEFFGPSRFRMLRKDKVNLAHLLTHRGAGQPGQHHRGNLQPRRDPRTRHQPDILSRGQPCADGRDAAPGLRCGIVP
jgi:CubicO group peptidase (beta-lactamase class C family)